MIDRAKSLVASGTALFGSSVADKVSLSDLSDVLQAAAALILVIAGVIAPSRARARAEAIKAEAILAAEALRVENVKTRRQRKPRVVFTPGQPTTNQPTQ